MILSKVLEGLDYEIIQGGVNVDIQKINYDSRKVKENDIFVCIKGFASDGHKYAHSAVKSGAKVIVCEDLLDIEENVTLIRVKDTRKALAIMGANYYDNPSKKMKIIGVTGTNGKTTSAFMVKTILEEEGKKEGLIGTIANYIGSKKIDAERTTPDSLELQELVKCLKTAQIEFETAVNNYEFASDPELIDYYTYNIKATQTRYQYLLRKAKEKGL